ncbi:MAG TPA: primosomal protein N' [Edaphocola sp.]|nr:primosomal protein N' [Edaphocola sp.]
MFVDIILPLHLPKPLTYGVPLQWQDKIEVGKRVEVNLGRQRLYSGIILEIHNNKPDAYQVKPIRNVIDEQPIVNSIQLAFWRWIAEYYLCSLNDVMQAALPAHLKLMSESLLIWTDFFDDVPHGLSDDAFLIAEALLIRKKMTIAEAQQLISGKALSAAINEVLETGAAIISEVLEERYKAKTELFVFLNEKYEVDIHLKQLFDELEKKPKQLAILMSFLHLKRGKKGLALKDLAKAVNATSTQINNMAKKGYFDVKSLAVDRLEDLENDNKLVTQLSDIQLIAKQEIEAGWLNKEVCLLQGVTGSGKTHIYIELIQAVISKGEQALFLLPEIALTTHILQRLKAYFGEELGVYHSKYSNNERIEIWKKVASKKYKVIIGPRSAIWLPFQNLGLIIVDEEHDTSYKQMDPAPRFYARDAAIYLSRLHQAKVLLGSATPSIESLYNVQTHKYAFISLKQRHLNVAMPELITVNARNTQAGFSPILTVDLLSAIQDTVKEGKQVILFQNKRGYAPFLMCGSCGFVPQCKYCDVSLTYHKMTDKLHCHYCGFKSAPIKFCPQCGGASIAARSFGTEKIEEDLQRIFPHYKTARMDWDSMNTRNKQQLLMNDFAEGKVQILVGTQMVVKGLDFVNVGLVGILSADSLLGFPDFRVNERAFQMMEQVSGRAGRVDGKGKVRIQTHKPQHPIIQFLQQHDFRGFFQFEISYRQQFQYPPFSKLIKLTSKHKYQQKAQQALSILTGQLVAQFPDLVILGPSEALVPRVRNQYIFEMMIKLPLNNSFNSTVKQFINNLKLMIPKEKGMSAVQIYADVDPY